MIRRIEPSHEFERDQRREMRGRYREVLAKELAEVLAFLVSDRPLPAKNRDHQLKNNLKHMRECHIRPDLLLVYQKPDAETLSLARLGSHSELFGKRKKR